MAVRILRSESSDAPVKIDLLVTTIETGRDRIRAIGNMLLTVSGILISVCFGFLLFLADKKMTDLAVGVSFIVAVLIFLISSCLSILSSFLRTKYTISNEAQFATDLLALFYSELRICRFSFITLLLGLLAMIIGTVFFMSKYWR